MCCSYKSCGASFTNNEERIEHMRRVHSRLKELYCEICGKMCQSKCDLDKHVLTVHEKKSLDVKCCECDKVFINHGSMSRHKNLVHFPDRFKCGECKKSFGCPRSLKAHEIVHTGEKKFQCDECGRQFRRIGMLKDHKISHTGRKDFVCEYCAYRGATWSLLYHHRRQKHKAEFEEEKKRKEDAKIKVSKNVSGGSTEGEGEK